MALAPEIAWKSLEWFWAKPFSYLLMQDLWTRFTRMWEPYCFPEFLKPLQIGSGYLWPNEMVQHPTRTIGLHRVHVYMQTLIMQCNDEVISEWCVRFEQRTRTNGPKTCDVNTLRAMIKSWLQQTQLETQNPLERWDLGCASTYWREFYYELTVS